MRVLGYCVMPNHWHLLLWPQEDGELAHFMMRLTNMHVRRWLTAHGQVGRGHLYQGRYKSFAMQDDDHLSTVLRYVERNAVRANLVARAQDWPWSGVGQSALPAELRLAIHSGPIPRRGDWMEWLNAPRTAAEEQLIRQCLTQGRPYGTPRWIERMMTPLGWREPIRPGRPRKATK
jgi:putative transposase